MPFVDFAKPKVQFVWSGLRELMCIPYRTVNFRGGPWVTVRRCELTHLFFMQSGEAEAATGAPAEYDAYGFPLDQEYMPTSRPAAHTPQHEAAWARHWAAQAHGAQQPEAKLQAKLQELVWRGIPTTLRGEIWPWLLGVPLCRRAQPDLYDALLAQSHQETGEDEPVAAQIAKDVDRTWPRHRWLDVAALGRVLLAFSRYNRTVGYCQVRRRPAAALAKITIARALHLTLLRARPYAQGLNNVAACLLLVMEEHDAFWSLVRLVEVRLPEGFWSGTLWRCRAEQEVPHHMFACRHALAMRGPL
jgi:hypothetical protein